MVDFHGVGPPVKAQIAGDIDGKDVNGTPIIIGGTTPAEKIDSFLSSLSKITDRRDKHPCWKSATNIKTNIGTADIDLLLEAGSIYYASAKANAEALWSGKDPNTYADVSYDIVVGNKERHVRRSLAEFIYNCLDGTLKNDVETELKSNPVDNIHHDGPMVWLTLMNMLFSVTTAPLILNREELIRTNLKDHLINMTIEVTDYSNYSIKVENGLQLQTRPELKTDLGFLTKLPNIHVINMVYENKKKKEENDNKEIKFPSDCYSFLSFDGERNYLGISVGLVVWTFQISILLLMVLSKVYKNLSANGEVDNPDHAKDDYFWATFVPSNATTIVRVAQILSLLAYVFFSDSSVMDMVRSVKTFPFLRANHNYLMVVSSFLRFVQGLLATFTMVILVMTSTSVIETILNFAAINFVSDLDDKAFEMARNGYFGQALEDHAEEIKERPLPYYMIGSSFHKKEWQYWILHYWSVVVFTLCFLLIFVGIIVINQSLPNMWRTQAFRVQFDSSTGLQSYSGCYNGDSFGDESNMDWWFDTYPSSNTRTTYGSKGDSRNDVVATRGQFMYCKKMRQWTFYDTTDLKERYDQYDDTESNVGRNAFNDIMCNRSNDLRWVYSSKTDFFDISTSFEEGWYSTRSKAPLKILFVAYDDDADCSTFQNGFCNNNKNSLEYGYDGGDCCATTCIGSDCGKQWYGRYGHKVFGTYRGFISFPYCTDRDMVDFTVRLNTIRKINRSDNITTSTRTNNSITDEDDIFLISTTEQTTQPPNTFCPEEKGYCVTSDGSWPRYNERIEIDSMDGDTDFVNACLEACHAYNVSGTIATGCRVYQNEWNQSCYVHTDSIDRGSNATGSSSSCWVFSKCSYDDDEYTSKLNLSIECDERMLLNVTIVENMKDQSETIKVIDGANCTMTFVGTSNSTDTTSSVEDWYVDYTIDYEYNDYYGDQKSTRVIDDNIVEINQTNSTMNIDFVRIPDDESLKNNGICDDHLNSPEYEYDGGDCCGATCFGPNCGKQSFGSKVFGEYRWYKTEVDYKTSTFISFPKCKDRDMVDLTIRLDALRLTNSIDITHNTNTNNAAADAVTETICPLEKGMCVTSDESRQYDSEFISIDSVYGNNETDFVHECLASCHAYNDTNSDSATGCEVVQEGRGQYCYVYTGTVDHGDNWDNSLCSVFSKCKTVDAYNTLNLLIECDERMVLNVMIDESMTGHSETIKVKDGAKCTMIFSTPNTNTTTRSELDWYVNYTVFHGNEESSLLTNETIVIVNNESNSTTTDINFIRIPDCFFETNTSTWKYPVTSTVYTDNGAPMRTVSSLIETRDTNCAEIDFNEKVTLVESNFSSNLNHSEPLSDIPTAPISTNNSTTSPILFQSPPESPTDCRSIAEIICSRDDLSTLCGQVSSTDTLVEEFSTGNWTLFAPNDNAFERLELDIGGLQALIKYLTLDRLRFHAVEDKTLPVNDLICDQLLEMANGKDTRTECDKKEIPFGQKGKTNEKAAMFNATDIQACNGIIHIIDDVLFYK